MGKQAAIKSRGAVREALVLAVRSLERVGCDAAGYRLSGEALDKLCVVHLWGRWRLLLAFAEPGVAAVVDLGEHIDNDRTRDIYSRLHEALDRDAPADPRDKPPCCGETGPPVDDAQLGALESGYRALARRRSRIGGS